jgi:fatty-acyl-CoA synthase
MTDLFDLTAQRASLGGGRTALVDVRSGDSLSYAGLDRRAALAAGLLAQCGVAPGDRVAMLCRNRVEAFELLFACAKLGAILVPLNWRLAPVELAGLLRDCRPRLLLYGREDSGVAKAAAKAAAAEADCIGLDDAGETGYAARLARAPRLSPRTLWPGRETWFLVYTSGTTGGPKAVIYTYGMVLANHVNAGQAFDLRGDDRTLCYLPLFHTAGLNLLALPTLIAGGTVLVLPGFDGDRVLALVEEGAIDIFFGVPTVYRQLSEHPRFAAADLARVRRWGCGGAPLPEDLLPLFLRRGAAVCNGMGMTETGPTLLIMDPANVAAKPGSVGKPQLLAAVRLVDAEGLDVGPDAVGELLVAGAAVTPGYWQRPNETRAAFTRDGWLRSGDLARRDSDGYYYIVGRLKEMFISGGENVFPGEIERVLEQHPDVAEAAVVGMPDRTWGEVGRAFVRLRAGTAFDAAALAVHCRERLAGYKVPREFVAMRDFPRTAAGKVQKHRLAEQAPA